MGTHFLVVAWLAVAFHLLGGIFWLFSCCCCSGKAKARQDEAEKAPYAYESLGPYGPGYGNNLYMQEARPQAAYEPFRHV